MEQCLISTISKEDIIAFQLHNRKFVSWCAKSFRSYTLESDSIAMFGEKLQNLSNSFAYLSHILKKGKRKATREGQFPKRRLNIMLPDATSSLPLYSFSSLSFQPAVLLLTLLSTATFASLRSLSLLLLPPPYPPPKKSRGNQEYKKRWKATGDSLITTGHFSLSRGAHLSPPSQPPRADEKQPQILSVAPLPPSLFFLPFLPPLVSCCTGPRVVF